MTTSKKPRRRHAVELCRNYHRCYMAKYRGNPWQQFFISPDLATKMHFALGICPHCRHEMERQLLGLGPACY